MVGTSIKTGVDKLVEIISETKRITVDEAAKKLGVGKNVVQEWAEFLEEEGLVTLEYSLSKVFITEKRITKEDVIKSAREAVSERDAFARKIEVAITALDSETSGFEDIRKEFTNVQGNIKNEIELVKKQLGELEKYDSLRKNLDKDVQKQRQEYDSFVKDAEDKLHKESQNFDELKSLIEKERKNIEQYSQKITDLKKLRADYERTIGTLKESLKNVDDSMGEYKKKFEASDKLMANYKQALDRLDSELSEKKASTVTRRIAELKEGQAKLFKNQTDLESDIAHRIGSLQSYSGVSDKMHKGVQGFFTKTIETEKLISEIENDKLSLKKDLESLRNKVLAFTLAASNAAVKSQLKEISDKLHEFDNRKAGIRIKVERLIALIHGKDK